MKFLSRRILSAALESPGLGGKVLLHGGLVSLFLKHSLVKQIADQPGYARVMLGRPDPRPPSHLLVQRNGYIFHAPQEYCYTDSLSMLQDQNGCWTSIEDIGDKFEHQPVPFRREMHGIKR
jgi:hypothetical protein